MSLCLCGCGQPAPIARRSDSRFGWVKGQPMRYIRGHFKTPSQPIEPRFWAFVDKRGDDECWEWKGARNPRHLFVGTHADNARDKVLKGRQWHPPRRSHCPQGHPYDEANTYVSRKGVHHCRACARERSRIRYAAKAAS